MSEPLTPEQVCPECGGKVVRLHYALAYHCVECLGKERDAEILDNERLRARLTALEAAGEQMVRAISLDMSPEHKIAALAAWQQALEGS